MGVRVTLTRLDRARGTTDGHRTIRLDHRLTHVEARCTLMHELIHVELGHRGRQPPAVEEKVRAATAHRLIPWESMLPFVGSDLHSWQIADALDVTPDVLDDRLQYATDAELRQLHERKQCAPWEA